MEIRIHDCDVENRSDRTNGTDNANDSRNMNGFERRNESDGCTNKCDDDRKRRQPSKLNAQGDVWRGRPWCCGVWVCLRAFRRFEFFAELRELRENIITAHVLLAGDWDLNREEREKEQKKRKHTAADNHVSFDVAGRRVRRRGRFNVDGLVPERLAAICAVSVLVRIHQVTVGTEDHEVPPKSWTN